MVSPSTVDNPSPDVKAATLVVNATGAEADFTTIAEALAALPAAGGVIYVREGTYTITSTLTMPDKPVKIIGSGKGVTIIDIGANAIAAFTIGFDREYTFEGFTINGDDATAGQIAFNHTLGSVANSSLDVVNMSVGLDVGTAGESNGIEKTFVFSAGSGLNQMHVVNSEFANGSAVTPRFFEGGTSIVSLVRVTARAGIAASASNFRLVRSTLQTLSAGLATLSLDAALSSFQSTVGVDLSVSGVRNQFTGCEFESVISVESSGMGFTGCNFRAASGPPARHLDVLAAATGIDVSGCTFNAGVVTAEAVRTASTGGIFTGNTDMEVTEIAAANENRYSNNSGFEGSTIIGLASIIDDWNTRTITTTPVTLDRDDRTALVDATGGARVVNLPTAANGRYQTYRIKKIDSSGNTVTIDASGAETIDGNLTVILNDQFAAVIIQSDGTEWHIVAKVIPANALLRWRADADTSPDKVQLTKVLTFEVANNKVQGVIDSVETMRDLSLLTNPTVRVQIAVTVAGSGTGNVRMRLTARYIAETELASKAADETLLITAPVATNTVQAFQADIVFTLDASLIADSDEINLVLERLGGDAADTFDGNIGIVETSRMDYLSN